MRNYKEVILIALLWLSTIGYGGSFFASDNYAQPTTLNNGGLHNLTSLNNEIVNNIGEVGVSSFSSVNYILYSGFVQTISYPNRITTLVATTGANDYEITLSWISPGADGSTGTCSGYDIRFSTTSSQSPAISEEQFQLSQSVSKFSPIPVPQSVGTLQTMTITGLLANVTYYFAIKARDTNYSWSFLSKGATAYAIADTISPAAITTLSALTGFSPGEIKLSWISPGDDAWSGNIVNGKYRIRYSTYTTDEPNFWTTSDSQWLDFINKYQIQWTTNTTPLSQEGFKLTGLNQGVTYYIRIWTADENNNWSEISNGATAQAQVTILSVIIGPTTFYNFGLLNLGVSSVSANGFTVTNLGNVKEKYSLRCTTITSNTTWVPSTSAGVDTFSLKAVFHPTRPQITDFGLEDSIVNNYTQSTNTIYSVDGTQVGFNIEVNGVRTIWYLLQMPTDSSVAGEQKFRVYIVAEEQD